MFSLLPILCLRKNRATPQRHWLCFTVASCLPSQTFFFVCLISIIKHSCLKYNCHITVMYCSCVPCVDVTTSVEALSFCGIIHWGHQKLLFSMLNRAMLLSTAVSYPTLLIGTSGWIQGNMPPADTMHGDVILSNSSTNIHVCKYYIFLFSNFILIKCNAKTCFIVVLNSDVMFISFYLHVVFKLGINYYFIFNLWLITFE